MAPMFSDILRRIEELQDELLLIDLEMQIEEIFQLSDQKGGSSENVFS